MLLASISGVGGDVPIVQHSSYIIVSLTMTYIRRLSNIVIIKVARVEDLVLDVNRTSVLGILTIAGLGGVRQRCAFVQGRLAAILHVGVIAVSLSLVDELPGRRQCNTSADRLEVTHL